MTQKLHVNAIKSIGYLSKCVNVVCSWEIILTGRISFRAYIRGLNRVVLVNNLLTTTTNARNCMNMQEKERS